MAVPKLYVLFFLVLDIAVCHGVSLAVDAADEEDAEENVANPRPRVLAGWSRYHNTACSGSAATSQATAGVCLGRLQCQREGGATIGSCGILGVCCAVERSCFSSSALKVSYFVGPSDTMATSCNFDVEVQNPAVCQVRLDFENFHLAQPTGASSDGLQYWYECSTDRFSITSPYSNNLGFRYLCGQNHGQHLYVPASSRTAMNYLVLSMHIGSRTARTSWRIRVTQLECESQAAQPWPLPPAHLLPLLQRQLQSLRAETPDDLHLLAPPGCLQYYTNTTGIFESFNYDGTSGIYLPDLNYAICFKRLPDTCEISYLFQDFHLGAVTGDSNYTNTDCEDTTFKDYLYIPSVSDNDQGIKFCGDQENLPAQVSKSPGPLQVQFHSGAWRLKIFQQYGFKIQYTVYNC